MRRRVKDLIMLYVGFIIFAAIMLLVATLLGGCRSSSSPTIEGRRPHAVMSLTEEDVKNSARHVELLDYTNDSVYYLS